MDRALSWKNARKRAKKSHLLPDDVLSLFVVSFRPKDDLRQAATPASAHHIII